MEKSNEQSEVSIQQFDINNAIEKLKSEEKWKSGKRNSLVLLKEHDMNIVLMALQKDEEIATHQANGRISVHVIEGELKFNTESESVFLKKGQIISLPKNVKHSLKALDHTSFLLTKVNP